MSFTEAVWLRGHRLLIIVFNLTPVLSEVGQFTPASVWCVWPVFLKSTRKAAFVG